MAHLHEFITDLAIILITAGIATIVFKWLKQPVVLGYILAGFIAGPHVTWLPTVTDMGNVEVWAEIGVIFLLFALGLEFSFKRLMAVGGTATIATLVNLGSMIIIGYFVGKAFGWSQMDSIFLGGMLSMSSTTIIIKAFNDMGLQKQRFAGIVFGMLIVEDLAAILMMVLLSTLAVSNEIEGTALLGSLFRLVFFILIWFVVGIYLIPTMLKAIKRFLNDETLLIIAMGFCFGMVLFASHVGFSAALGAFIMGSILAETVAVKHIERLVEPLKNFFGAVFFVSVGMMLAPDIVREHSVTIAVLVVVVLIGRVIFATLGVLASGEGLKVSLQAGFSLAQIGEFSFIIATLGTSLGVISNTLYPIIVSVSIITTFTTPYCIRLATPLYAFIEKRIPSRWNTLITGYTASKYKTVNTQNDWNKLLKSILQLVAIYSALAIAVLLLCERFTTPYIIEYIPGRVGRIISATLTISLMAPFLRAILMKKNRSEEFKNLWGNNYFNRGILILLIASRVFLCMILILMVLTPLFSNLTIWMSLIGFVVIIFIILSQGFKKQSRKMEARFLSNLNLKQTLEENKAAIPSSMKKHLLSKEIHIEEIEITPNSPKIGKSLHELNFRQKTGVSVVTILRGNRKINIPDAHEKLYPYDRIVIAGSDDNIQRLIKSIEERKSKKASCEEQIPEHHVELSQYIVEEESPIVGKTIAQLNLPKNTECMIISVERGEETITILTGHFVFQKDDILLLAGEKNKLRAFEENLNNRK
ncbi:sodium:proton antiporter [Bacteroides sp. 214]|uniref:cation:proton antiporter domain-containing protein n=1 Tax=Bacteroides sp. 214 TaxID=2302935 RepID=UPI0013D1A4B0|nr:cation:proton antiporter [Bacteroides sp. 214]NDW11532.1 sodium:proton antiporter [Bacteroides sp. 214]